jgi:hypothetical protein
MVLKIGAQYRYQFVNFPTAIELLGIDSGFQQIELIGFTIGIHFYGHR